MQKMTLDKLGRIVSAGFDGVDKRFDSIEKDMGKLKDGQASINTKLDQFSLKTDHNELKDRVERIEIKIGLKKS